MTTESITPTTNYELDPTFKNLEGNNRFERAQIITQNPRAVKRIGKSEWVVKSQTNKSVYTVTYDGTNYHCNCPDCVKNNCECKHILAVKETLHEKLVHPNKSERDWSTYSLGQINEYEYFDTLLKELAETVPTPEQTGRGRRARLNSDKVICAVKKVADMKSCRRTQKSREQAVESGLITSEGGYNEVNAFLRREDMTPVLRELVRLSASPMVELEHKFAVDSSGFRTTGFGEWCDTKHGSEFTNKSGSKTIKAERQHEWVKCHICTGTLTNIITDVIVTPREGNGTGDVNNFAELVRNTAKTFKVEEVMADAGYPSKENFDEISKLGADAYIYFKGNATFSSGKAWKKALANFIVNHDNYMQHYNKRNNVESTFGALKAKFKEVLMSKTYTAQVNELLCKIIAYNISVIVSAMYVHDLKVDF